MASKTINPTRMELTRLKGRLRTAVRGHRLLKDKRDELMRQFFLIVRENKELRAKVEQGIEEANRAMTVASSVMSPEMLQQALLYPKQSATLDMTFQNIMSVSVPVYEFHTKNEDAASIYPYGFAQTSGELDDALGALASGATRNLLQRAGDVALKEGLPLVLVTRESPLSAVHLRNMLTLREAGAVIMPFSPGFYLRPQSLEDLLLQTSGRIFDQLGLAHSLGRWADA